MDQIGEEAKSRRPWLRAQPLIDGEEGEEPARPVVGVAIQGVGEGDGGVAVVVAPSRGSGTGAGAAGIPLLSVSAVAFSRRNTPASKATSSDARSSWNHTRS